MLASENFFAAIFRLKIFALKSDIRIRMFDFGIACAALLFTAPLQALIALHIFLIAGENPFFVQRRALTLEKKNFKIYKFKTLKSVSAERSNNSMFQKEIEPARFFFLSSFLRRSGLDELPQLINVLKGEMSIVGPRPLSLGDLKIFKNLKPNLYAQRNMLDSKPGITGLWQIFGDRYGGYENLVRCDFSYESSKTFSHNIFIMLATIPVMLFAKHKDAICSARNSEMRFAQRIKDLS